MKRRTLLVAACTALVTAGCTGRGRTGGPASAAASVPPGGQAVARWTVIGGYTRASVLALEPPRLVVYPDGKAVADAAYRSNLPVADVSDLLTRLAKDLEDQDTTERPSQAAKIADAATTVFTVRTADGTRSVRAYALDDVRDEDAYPKALYDARDRLGTLRQRVMSGGLPYTAERVRIVADVAAPDAVDIKPWPAEVAVPVLAGREGIRLANLDGKAAQDVVRLLPRDLDLNGAWQTYRTADNELLRTSWRYLLPDE